MEYEYLEEAGKLEIKYRGGTLDAYTLAILHLNFQDIFDKVAYATLSRDGLLLPRRGRFKPPYRLPPYSDFNLIRAEITRIGVGSLFEELGFLIPAFLADPDVRAVLAGLVSNIIFAITNSGVRGIHTQEDKNQRQKPFRRLPRDPEVGENVRDIIIALSQNGGGELTFSHQTPQGSKTEVTVRVDRRG